MKQNANVNMPNLVGPCNPIMNEAPEYPQYPVQNNVAQVQWNQIELRQKYLAAQQHQQQQQQLYRQQVMMAQSQAAAAQHAQVAANQQYDHRYKLIPQQQQQQQAAVVASEYANMQNPLTPEEQQLHVNARREQLGLVIQNDVEYYKQNEPYNESVHLNNVRHQ